MRMIGSQVILKSYTVMRFPQVQSTISAGAWPFKGRSPDTCRGDRVISVCVYIIHFWRCHSLIKVYSLCPSLRVVNCNYLLLIHINSSLQTTITPTSSLPWNGCLHPHAHFPLWYTLPFVVEALEPVWDIMSLEVMRSGPGPRSGFLWGSDGRRKEGRGEVGRQKGSRPRRQSWIIRSAGRG